MGTKPRKCSIRRATDVVRGISQIEDDAARRPHFAQFFETAD